MKTKLLKYGSRLIRKEWLDNKKIKILIQTNPYFNPQRWTNNLVKYYKKYKEAEIKFVNSRFFIYQLVSKADFAFLWSINRHYELYRSRLKLIYLGTAGTDNLNYPSIPPFIAVDNPKGISSKAIAEYCLAMAIVCHRNLYHSFNNQSRRRWTQKIILEEQYVPLNRMVVGIMGLGHNGKMIARYFSQLGCTIAGYDQNPDEVEIVDDFYPPELLNDFLNATDVLIVALPLNQETRGLLNYDRLKRLKKNAIIINVARGPVIVESDLSRIAKRLKAVVLDVFGNEPLGYFDRKWNLPRTVITPHISGNVNLFVDDIQKDFIQKINALNV